MTKFSKKRQRNQKGNLVIEMIISLPMIIVMGALCLDGAFGLLASLALDETCIDAARAASRAEDIQAASACAQAVARSHERPTILPEVTILEFNTLNGKYLQGPYGPYLVLETKINYTLPIPVSCFGHTLTPKRMQLTRKYLYPILPVKYESAGNSNGGDPFDDSD